MPPLPIVLCLAGLLGLPLPAAGAATPPRQTLRVGPGLALTAPSQAARLARDGDLVEIEAGDYRGDVAVWTQSNLILRGVHGRARLAADGRAAEGKAIWVIRGDRVEVENLEFSGAKVPSRNGAGIRAEGIGLTVRNCRFHHNEMGLLTSNRPEGVYVITGSEFDHNFTAPDLRPSLGHNLYIGRARSLTLTDSRIHGAQAGHGVKSRAQRNRIIGNDIRDGDGAGSYLIDLSEGGQAEIARNQLEKSALAPNRRAIAFAAEANAQAPGQTLKVQDNSYRVSGNPGTFVHNFSLAEAVLTDNRIEGGALPLAGPGEAR